MPSSKVPEELPNCHVCRKPLSLSALGTLYPCKHVFDITCIREWLTTPSQYCPLYKRHILTIHHIRPDGTEDVQTVWPYLEIELMRENEDEEQVVQRVRIETDNHHFGGGLDGVAHDENDDAEDEYDHADVVDRGIKDNEEGEEWFGRYFGTGNARRDREASGSAEGRKDGVQHD